MAWIKAKTFPNDQMSVNDFSLVSPQIEVKTVARNEELKQTLQQIEMKEMHQSHTQQIATLVQKGSICHLPGFE